jgi:hypothetical protein
LAIEVAANALNLVQDAFGNYVVQYVLDMQIDGISQSVMLNLRGNYVQCSLQKFSSNVVEKVRAKTSSSIVALYILTNIVHFAAALPRDIELSLQQGLTTILISHFHLILLF